MNYREACEYIKSRSNTFIKPGLERVRRLLEAMGNPEKEFRTVHVTGTNGKGSTCAMIATAVAKSGVRVGVFSSPFILKINEYMRVEYTNGVKEDITDEEFVQIVEYMKPIIDGMEDDRPTEFEISFALACEFFKRKGCELCVIEVGMGGRRDATNVIQEPLVAVFTNIGVDHVKYLGSTVADIAKEKSGIIKDNCDVVCYPFANEALEVIKSAYGREHNCAGRHFLVAQDNIREYAGFKDVKLRMKGSFQERNAAVVLETIRVLNEKGYNIQEEDIKSAFEEVLLPGRCEIISEKPLVIADGGHNPQCVSAFAETLREMGLLNKVVFVIGVMADKDYNQMIKQIKPFAVKVYGVRPDNDRALDVKTLGEAVRKNGILYESCDSIKAGVRGAAEYASANDFAMAISGSFYMLGEAKNEYKSFYKQRNGKGEKI